MEEKTYWTILSVWPKRSDDDEDDGSRTKRKDCSRSQWNGIGGDKPERKPPKECGGFQRKESAYAGLLVGRLSGDDSGKRVWLQSAAAWGECDGTAQRKKSQERVATIMR